MSDSEPKKSIPSPTKGKALLILGFSLSLGFAAATLLYGIQQRQKTINDINLIVNKQSQKSQLLTLMKGAARERTLCLFYMVNLDDPFERDHWFLEFNRHGAIFANARMTLLGLIDTEAEKDLIREQGKRSGFAIPVQLQIVDLAQAGDIDAAKRLLTIEGIPLQNAVFTVIDKYQNFLRDGINSRINTINENHKNTLKTLVVLGIGSFMIGLFLAVYVIRTTTKFARLNFIEKRLAQVTLGSIGDAVITTDADSLIQFMNSGAIKLTGWPLSEALNKPIQDIMCLVDSKTTKPLSNPITQAIATRKSITSDHNSALIDRNKNRYEIEYTASAIVDALNKNFGGVVVFRDVTERREMAKQLTFQASHDELTGLVNRREFEVRLNQAIEVARSEYKQFALLYLDLDQFKIINDMGGHNAGDELLKQLSQAIHRMLRESDTLARLGGDEFGILLDGCPLTKATEIAESIRNTIDKFHFYWEDKVFDIGVSIGIVMITEDSHSIAEVMSAVDTACYTAKDLGRNRTQVFQPGNQELNKRKSEMYWSQRITKAIDEDSFCLYAQEIIASEAKDQKQKKFEILLRLKEQDDQVINPDVFLPAAERFSLTAAIDKWVIAKTLLTIAAKNLQPEEYSFSINLSGQSLNTHDMLGYIINTLEETGVAADMIHFEITETMAISNITAARKFISVLKGLGCKFSLDDFGKGLSSFTYLKHIPVDSIKIDGSFIRDVLNDHVSITFVNAINEIAHAMNIETIAEYVKNEAIYNEIIKLNVDYLQGNYISPAIPLSECLK